MDCTLLKDLYEAIIEEIIQYCKKKGNEKLIVTQKEKNYSKINMAIFIISNAKVENSFKSYQKFLTTFLDNIKYQIEEVKIFTDISDDDCFLAYGIMCGFYCMFKEKEESIFETFNIELFPKILEVIKQYTDIEKLKNIYINKLKSFTQEFVNVNNESNKFINWFKILYEKDLSSIPTIKRKKKKNKKKNKISKINKLDENKLEDEKDHNLKENLTKYQNGENTTNVLNEENKKNDNAIESEETKSQNGEITQTGDAKSNNGNKNDIAFVEENEPQNNIENEDLSLGKAEDFQKEIIINNDDNISQEDKKGNNPQNNNLLIEENNKENNREVILKELDNNQSSFNKNEKLVYQLLKSMNQELKSTNQKLNSMNQELKESKQHSENLTERVELLEQHQVLLFNQIALYQNSRDNGKSIFYYLYKYFNLGTETNIFERTKQVFNYLENNINDEKISDSQKLIMKKFLGIMHFINQYHNKILHNQIKSKTKKIIKEIQKKNKDFPVFPEFNYKQFMESIKYFIENISSNKEIQAVLYDAYETYVTDKDLGPILEANKKAISLENQIVVFKIANEEIDKAINFLDNLMIGNEKLESLCDHTTWDQSTKKQK